MKRLPAVPLTARAAYDAAQDELRRRLSSAARDPKRRQAAEDLAREAAAALYELADRLPPALGRRKRVDVDRLNDSLAAARARRGLPPQPPIVDPAQRLSELRRQRAQQTSGAAPATSAAPDLGD